MAAQRDAGIARDARLRAARLRDAELRSAGAASPASARPLTPNPADTEYLVRPPTKTVTPGKVPVPMAVSPPMFFAYQAATGFGHEKDAQGMVDQKEVVLISGPQEVLVETTFRGLAYVRPTDGLHKGTFLVVDERYVK